jgi:hypothetical protein
MKKDEHNSEQLDAVFEKRGDNIYLTRTDLRIYDYETKEYIQRVISDLESYQKSELKKQTEIIGKIQDSVAGMKTTVIQLMAGLFISIILMFLALMVYNIFGVAL